jgi:OOP family OmpA-OmpF porin
MYKKILCACVLALGLGPTAFAEDFGGSEYDAVTADSEEAGIYFGGQLGMSNMHYGSRYTVPGNTVDNSKFASRAYLGYAFSQFISAELGYDYYGRPKFTAAGGSGNTQDILQQGMDLVAKAALPLDYGFGFYIKGGLAWVHRSNLNGNGGMFDSKESNDRITPVGGLGINYWFAPNIALDLSWTKTMTVSDLPTIDFISLGIVYKLNI